MRRPATIAVALLLAFVAFAAVGCGGDDESTSTTGADEWAAGFCSAVTSWTDELQTIGDEITDPSSLDADTLKDAGESVNSATETFIEDVQALGSPDTESGEEVRSSLDTLTDTLEAERADIEEAANGVSGLTDLPAAISTIGTSLTAMGTAFQTALEAIEDADVGEELETAFEDSDACAEITS